LNFPNEGVGGQLAPPSDVSVEFSLVGQISPEYVGPGTIDADPLFVDSFGPDGFSGTGDEDLRLMPGSPAIDAASNSRALAAGVTCDIEGDPRFFDDPMTLDTGEGSGPITDMGAYEFRDASSQPCPADLDGDCLVGAPDLASLIASWGDTQSIADLSGDGVVGAADLAALIAAWGVCP